MLAATGSSRAWVENGGTWSSGPRHAAPQQKIPLRTCAGFFLLHSQRVKSLVGTEDFHFYLTKWVGAGRPPFPFWIGWKRILKLSV